MSAPPGYDGGSLLPSPPTDPTIHVMRGGDGKQVSWPNSSENGSFPENTIGTITNIQETYPKDNYNRSYANTITVGNTKNDELASIDAVTSLSLNESNLILPEKKSIINTSLQTEEITPKSQNNTTNILAPAISTPATSEQISHLNQEKQEEDRKEDIKFSEEEKEILKKYGLNEGGPIDDEIDNPTKKLFLEQINNPICKTGTGDGIIFNNACSAIIPVLRALIQKEIERANAQISEMFQKTPGLYETMDLDKTTEEAGKLLSALRSKLDTNAPGLMENLASSKAIETAVKTDIDKKELVKLKEKVYEQVKEFAAKKAIQQSQPVVLKKGVRPGSVANKQPSKENIQFSKPKKNFVNRLENKLFTLSRNKLSPRSGSVANSLSRSKNNLTQKKSLNNPLIYNNFTNSKYNLQQNNNKENLERQYNKLLEASNTKSISESRNAESTGGSKKYRKTQKKRKSVPSHKKRTSKFRN